MTKNENISRYIDHTLLKPDATQEQIIQLCQEAKEYQFASVCVNPYWVSLCKGQLKDTDVKVCTVIGFPLGANTTVVKVAETLQAIEDGADEVDMVMNINALKSGKFIDVETDIRAVTEAVKKATQNNRIKVKVILEACLLSDEEKILACELSEKAGADFIKTSTGFSSGGATVEDVKLLKKTVGSRMEVKASGGIRDIQTALAMIKAGATRLGTSSGVKIVMGQKAGTDSY
ncbi:MAG: deoxyribose-phosphate aldolase [Candidatus Neomarinimicrobiota bacterium]|nr:deoxyribose-phosphate aldolase [Candidatus Neomarinimicrobiota bacterium]RKY48133.1 MAG: deoxyribose-phosphate aldolase [Candidatus Neomarinimicrobiota bacterium]